LALASSKIDLAEQCLLAAEDISGLLLIYTSTGNAKSLEELAKLAVEKGKNNVAFLCFFLLRRLEDCINLLCDTGRIPEAAFLARTYLPSHVPQVVKLWRLDLQTINEKAAESLADPMEYENLFPDLQLALKAEQYFRKNEKPLPASKYLQVKDDLDRDLIEEIRALEAEGIVIDLPPQPAAGAAPSVVVPAVASPDQSSNRTSNGNGNVTSNVVQPKAETKIEEKVEDNLDWPTEESDKLDSSPKVPLSPSSRVKTEEELLREVEDQLLQTED